MILNPRSEIKVWAFESENIGQAFHQTVGGREKRGEGFLTDRSNEQYLTEWGEHRWW